MSRFEIHGARGSSPVSGEAYRRYGGHTSCFSLETEQGLLIVDAGSGIIPLGEALQRRGQLPPVTLLLTHVHLDHILGLPSFKPLLRKDAEITICLEPVWAGAWHGALTTLVSRPLWPVDLLQLGATIRFERMLTGPFSRYGITVTRCVVSHPQGGLSYRLAVDDRDVVIATDREPGDATLDERFQLFAHGAGTLIHDAQYTPEELPLRRGWGHSSWMQSAEAARAVGAETLLLVSHDPTRSDDDVDRIVEQARGQFPQTIGGAEGQIVWHELAGVRA